MSNPVKGQPAKAAAKATTAAKAPARTAAAKAAPKGTKAAPKAVAKAPAAAKTKTKPETAVETVEDVPTLPKVQDPWSVLATQVNNSRSVGELVTKAGLKGWNVRREPALAAVPTGKCMDCDKPAGEDHAEKCYLAVAEEGEEFDGKVDENDTTDHVEIPGAFALIRTDPKTGRYEAIGSTTRTSDPVAIEDRANMLADIVKQTKAKFGPAGPLWGNTAGFLSLRMPERVKIGKGAKSDELELRVVLICSVNGKKSQIMVSPVRPATATVQHFGWEPQYLDYMSNTSIRASEASEAIAMVQSSVEIIEETASKMLATKMELAEFNILCNELWKPPSMTANTRLKDQHKLRKSMLEILFFGEHESFSGLGQTRWSAWQAIQFVAQHMPHVKVNADEKEAELARRAEQALFGGMAKISATAYQELSK
ncbi:DUF932 domain-containing protein [Amycolatopsis anabasis]|uniref:DUF932 domain-containing protein n=1 Tax=Amycolatopsis anabasis TaxID=1840409 RepID=UPI00131D1F45|nr:DUF932 domain-containing protein [Amycolatopsis anabasis]